jgi:D-arabinose 1-dehydrogenase-like Zn-dependent alcohol dehydrogenase
MSQTSYALLTEREETISTMKALVFYGPGQIGLETVAIPKPRAGEAAIRVTLTTICGTDLRSRSSPKGRSGCAPRLEQN